MRWQSYWRYRFQVIAPELLLSLSSDGIVVSVSAGRKLPFRGAKTEPRLQEFFCRIFGSY